MLRARPHVDAAADMGDADPQRDTHPDRDRHAEPHTAAGRDSQWHVTESTAPKRTVRLQRTDATGELTRLPNGEIRADWTAHIDHPAQLHSAVRMTLAYALSFNGTFLLHASGTLRRGTLWLFAGPSGTGKSTIAEELSEDGTVFCTDQAVLTAADSGVTARPTPLSDFEGRCKITRPHPITALVFIQQSTGHAVRRLTERETGTRLLQNISFIPGAEDRTQAVLEQAATVVSAVPAYLLSFAKDNGFWSLMDTLLPTGAE